MLVTALLPKNADDEGAVEMIAGFEVAELLLTEASTADVISPGAAFEVP
jgi:hypothetical protein